MCHAWRSSVTWCHASSDGTAKCLHAEGQFVCDAEQPVIRKEMVYLQTSLLLSRQQRS